MDLSELGWFEIILTVSSLVPLIWTAAVSRQEHGRVMLTTACVRQ